MKSQTGVWIDHREAVVVKLSDSGEEITVVESDAEKQPRRSSDRPTGSFEPLQQQSDDTLERKFKADLERFYDKVILKVKESKSILILGPGEAKTEFRKQLSSVSGAGTEISVETADRMTQPRIVAAVRQFFESR